MTDSQSDEQKEKKSSFFDMAITESGKKKSTNWIFVTLGLSGFYSCYDNLASSYSMLTLLALTAIVFGVTALIQTNKSNGKRGRMFSVATFAMGGIFYFVPGIAMRLPPRVLIEVMAAIFFILMLIYKLNWGEKK